VYKERRGVTGKGKLDLDLVVVSEKLAERKIKI
jgi:hypothetical protein